MNFELSGKVKVIQDPQTFSSGFSKRELVVSVEDGNYTQDINFEFLKEKADLLNDLVVGEEVNVSFNIRGREYNGKYFNNLTAWRIEKIANQVQVPTATAAPAPTVSAQENEDDFWKDVPF
ncbi:DUF3127 domain-containing protein [Porticoccaceae bacterium]|nr:DUF3127 domain-containing protein [Porticoccaceae bacterium]